MTDKYNTTQADVKARHDRLIEQIDTLREIACMDGSTCHVEMTAAEKDRAFLLDELAFLARVS